MIGWLWRVIIGRFSFAPSCEHKWAVKGEYTCHNPFIGERVSSIEYHCQCEKCGEWKKFSL